MKKVLCVLLLVILMGVTTNAGFAKTIEPEKNDGNYEKTDEKVIDQQEIDRRLKVVFDYLNEYANDVDFNGQSHLIFEIPIEENIVVYAKISNQEALKARAIGSSSYSVSANTTYNYTLTLNNIVGTGDTTVYTVNYTTGDPVSSGKDAYRLTVNKVSIKGTAPSGYSLGNNDTWIGNTNGNLIVDTGGYIKYTRVLWADKTVNFNKVSLGSVVGSKVVVDYSYDVN